MERLRDTWKVELLGADTERPNEELVSLAWKLGLDFNRGAWLSLLVNRTPVRLSLEFDSGVATAVHVSAELEHAVDAGERPQLVVRRERRQDRVDKENGLTREVQTGITAFDGELFLDSDATDEEVQGLLAREPTREALLRLITDQLSTEVLFTPRSISARVPRQGTALDEENLLTVIEAVVTMARGGGPRGRVRARPGAKLERALRVAVPTSFGAAALAYVLWETTWTFPVAWGVFLGAPAAVVTWLVARPVVRGDSDSGRRLSSIAALAGVGVAFVVVTALLAVNALLGSGEVRTASGVVSSVRATNDDDSPWEAVVRWQDGRPLETLGLRDEPEVGAPVTRSAKAGYFEPWDVKYLVGR